MLYNAKINDTGLKEIAKLPGLVTLVVADNPITDQGLKEIANCKTVRYLNLQYTGITGEGLKHLLGLQLISLTLPEGAKTAVGLQHHQKITQSKTELYAGSWKLTDDALLDIDTKSLRIVDLSYTKITDTALKSFTKSTNLTKLNLRGCQISGEQFAVLAGLPYLTDVDLLGCPVTDAGLKAIVKVKSIETLSLNGEKLKENGVQPLQELPALKMLSLSVVEINDKLIEQLTKLKSLKNIDIHGPRITSEQYKKLREALPNCHFQ